MRYSIHEYWPSKRFKVASLVLGLILLIVGWHLAHDYSQKGNEAGDLYFEALANVRWIKSQMAEAAGAFSEHEVNLRDRQIDHESALAKDYVDRRNRYYSAADFYASIAFFGGCILVFPIILYLIRVTTKVRDGA